MEERRKKERYDYTWGLDNTCSLNRSAKEYHEFVSKMDKTFVWQHSTSYTTGAIYIYMSVKGSGKLGIP